MKLLKQFSLILVILALGGSIIGIIILFLLLKIGIIKIDKVEDISNFLLDNMAIFFIPAGVSLIQSLDIISSNIIVLAITIIISTILVMSITAIVVEKMIKRKY